MVSDPALVRDVPSAPRRAAEFQGRTDLAWVAQLVERVLGKDEVTGSIPVPGSSFAKSRIGRRGIRLGGETFLELGRG